MTDTPPDPLKPAEVEITTNWVWHPHSVTDLRVHPLLVDVPLDVEFQVGLVSLTVVPSNHASMRFVTVSTDSQAMWRLPTVEVSFGAGAPLGPEGAGGGGGDGWMHWNANFVGLVPDPPGPVTVSLFERGSLADATTISVTAKSTARPVVTYRAVDDVEDTITQDRRLVLPRSITAVRSAVDGADDHVVISVEHWERTSVVLVYAAGEHRQMPDIAPRARARDDLGRTYDVRSEGGGTWCAGAAVYLRITPAIPDDIDRLHLDPVDSTTRQFAAVALPVR